MLGVYDDIIEEQISYYRHRAAEYDTTAYASVAMADRRIARITATLPMVTSALELACGTGIWTAVLAGRTDDLTAVDASAEAIEIARSRCPATVDFVCADIFSWAPDRRYDLVFFAFWLSHVPARRLAGFFKLLERSLVPSGEVVFVDEHISESAKERATATAGVIERTTTDGTTFRLVKRFVDPPRLTARLESIGWSCGIERDGADWVIGRARPRREQPVRPG